MALDITPRGKLRVETIQNGPIETNTYVAVSGGEAVVIDPAWEGERLAEQVASLCPGTAVKAIVCTHCHGDHVGGVAGMRRALGPELPFLISAVDAGGIEAACASMRRRWGIEVELPGAPTRLLAAGDVVEVGDAMLQVLETPGHTPGGIVLFSATGDGNLAFVGDTLFPGSAGRTDLEGGDARAILASLALIGRELPEDTLCLCGHGPSTTIGRERAGNPYMREGLARGL